jgi:hypothetical protein
MKHRIGCVVVGLLSLVCFPGRSDLKQQFRDGPKCPH